MANDNEVVQTICEIRTNRTILKPSIDRKEWKEFEISIYSSALSVVIKGL